MLRHPGWSRLARSARARASYLEVWNYVTGSCAATARTTPYQSRCCRSLHAACRLRADDELLGDANRLLNDYKASLNISPATHEIRDLGADSLEGASVVLHGYLGNRSDMSKKLSFAPLISRDLLHSVQVISSAKTRDGEPSTAHAELKQHGAGTPVLVRGTLKARPPAPDPPAGEELTRMRRYEVQLTGLEILNSMPSDILFTSDAVYPPEQRHLHMRQNSSIRNALAFRSRVARACRTCLEDDFGFSEIETPLLFKSTPEGAREFVVPTRRAGLAYALPQSPQQFKQVLMGSGVSRYYQLARCFRDEDLRADRQPEFTQLDLEMSFAGSEEVMTVITTLIRRLWGDLLDIQLPEQFQRMTYADAMAKYGVDKPDVRFGMELSRVDYLLPVDLVSKISPLSLPAVDAMVFKFDESTAPSETRKFISAFLDSTDAAAFHSNPSGGPGVFIVDSSKPLSGLQPLGWEAAEALEDKFELEDGDLLILQARPDVPHSGGSTPIGNLRLALHKEAVAQELIAAPSGFSPLWITDFPLFTPIEASSSFSPDSPSASPSPSPTTPTPTPTPTHSPSSYSSSSPEPGQGGLHGLASTHHPFTSPKTSADVDLLLTSPRSVIGEHYDLVMNGIELGGGSRRIHNADVQRLVMERVLGMPPERVAEFEHLLTVLRAGCPPHAGIALGFDRLVAVMLGKRSVREVIAFPKTGGGEDVLMKAPGKVGWERLGEYHLRVVGAEGKEGDEGK